MADCQGIPHAFTCAWDSVADDWDTVFRLSPLTSRQFDDVLEAWAIWKRWREAFDAGRLRESDRHPALAEEHTRWDELQARLKAAKRADDDATVVWAIPEFRGESESREGEVRWTIVEGQQP